MQSVDFKISRCEDCYSQDQSKLNSRIDLKFNQCFFQGNQIMPEFDLEYRALKFKLKKVYSSTKDGIVYIEGAPIQDMANKNTDF